jgi:ribosomal protein S18 acetylase RimI-like enzyme
VEVGATPQRGDVVVARASSDDALTILTLRDDLAAWMVEHGIEQWRSGEMPLAWIETCAAHGWLFAASRNGSLVGSVTLVWTDPFVWGDQNEPAGYIHMLMVRRADAGSGLGRRLLEWAENQIRSSGLCVARLDCVRSNARLREYYESAGYSLVGHRDFPGDSNVALGDTTSRATALYEKRLNG